MECEVPLASGTEIVATPFVTGPLPTEAVPSRKLTEPVGAASPDVVGIVAVRTVLPGVVVEAAAVSVTMGAVLDDSVTGNEMGE